MLKSKTRQRKEKCDSPIFPDDKHLECYVSRCLFNKKKRLFYSVYLLLIVGFVARI